ncbi:MAG: DUF559 domain-containing protein [Micrococcaceae bacterium]
MNNYQLIQEFQNQLIVSDSFNRNYIHYALAQQKLLQLAPARYVSERYYNELKPWDKALLRAIAFGRCSNNFVLSNQSAARIYGFGVLHVEKNVHVRTSSRQSTRFKGITVHAYKDPIDVYDVAGLKVTHPAQTVIDCARSLPYAEGLAIADGAYKQGLGKPFLEEYLKEIEFSRGRKKVYRVLNNATHLSGSPGETECRVALEEIGMPTPILQFAIHVNGNQYYADFAYPDFKLIIEFDGMIKYKANNHESSRMVIQEKIREDNIRSLGWSVIRLVTTEIRDSLTLWKKLRNYL